jgi:hypothetical protein
MNEEFELRTLSSLDMFEQAVYISTYLKRFRRAVKSKENRNDYIIAICKAEPESHISTAVNMHDLLESMTHLKKSGTRKAILKKVECCRRT